jgi:hypothetical protein
MTTMTMNALNGTAHAKLPSFDIRAALPDMPRQGSLAFTILSITGRLTLAAVPFGAIGWMFLAH